MASLRKICSLRQFQNICLILDPNYTMQCFYYFMAILDTVNYMNRINLNVPFFSNLLNTCFHNNLLKN